MICDECETVAHCMKNGCVPKHQALERMAENARELGLDYEQYKNAIEVSVIFHEGQRMFAVPKQPAPPPECQTEAEKTAFAFGWFKALESVRQQPAPVAKPHEQEPVAWLKVVETPGGWGKFVEAKPNEKGAKPVYLGPQAREWVGLTDEDKEFIAKRAAVYDWHDYEVIEASEAKLKAKNSP